LAIAFVLTPPLLYRSAHSPAAAGHRMMCSEGLWAMGQRPLAPGIATRVIEYSGLAVLVGGVFVVIVVGGGALLRLHTPHPGLTLVAAVSLAVSFDSARRGLRRLANRVVYGHRTSPWEAVSRLSVQMGHDRDPVELLEELCGVIRAGTGAKAVAVWLRIDQTWVPTVGSSDWANAEPVAVDGGELPERLHADLTVPIRQGGELLAAVTVSKAGPGSLIPLEERLVTDLASHAGIISRTLHLRETLRRRLEVARQRQQDLVSARIRMVAAQDEERRRLERDIHDTCQQQAVVLAGRLGLAGVLAHPDPVGTRAVLHEALADVDRLALALRRLTSAAPVPDLVADGIAAALRAQTASLPAVEIEDRIVRRYHPEVEATVYFCCVEAIQNASKHAKASRIQVRLSAATGQLRCCVRDDGVGFDLRQEGAGTGLRNIRERLRPWHGRLIVESTPAGTEVTVEIPMPREVPS
jgi:signal transduction histidine kinase